MSTQKVLSASEVAKKVLQRFPGVSSMMANHTCVFDNQGNAVIDVTEYESGRSLVYGYPCPWKTYSRMSKEEKQMMINNIDSMQVDIVIRKHKDGFETTNYWIKGAYEEYLETHKSDYVAGYEIKSYNY